MRTHIVDMANIRAKEILNDLIKNHSKKTFTKTQIRIYYHVRYQQATMIYQILSDAVFLVSKNHVTVP